MLLLRLFSPCTLRRHVSYRGDARRGLFSRYVSYRGDARRGLLSRYVSHRGDARGRLLNCRSTDLLLGLLSTEPLEKRVGDEHLQDALGGRIDGGEEVD